MLSGLSGLVPGVGPAKAAEAVAKAAEAAPSPRGPEAAPKAETEGDGKPVAAKTNS
jgi:hypothetical protein